MVKRVRGVAWATRVSPQMCNRLVDGTRSVLNQLLSDVYIFTDHMVRTACSRMCSAMHKAGRGQGI